MTSLCYSFAVALALLFLTSNGDDGLQCTTAPYNQDGFSGEIIRSWKFRGRENMANFIPRYTEHGFAPKDDTASTKYKGLDLWVAKMISDNTSNYVTLKFQREAKVYLFVGARNKGSPALTYSDWTPEGWARGVVGNFSQTADLGVYKPRKWAPMRDAFVFSKPTVDMTIDIPGRNHIQNNVVGGSVRSSIWLLISELDGSPVAQPALPTGVPAISAGYRCPAELHDLWLAPVREGETDIGDKRFRTTHPVWDPCYWW